MKCAIGRKSNALMAQRERGTSRRIRYGGALWTIFELPFSPKTSVDRKPEGGLANQRTGTLPVAGHRGRFSNRGSRPKRALIENLEGGLANQRTGTLPGWTIFEPRFSPKTSVDRKS
ncbi:MAG TPA: hypothetical protein VLV78_04020 [Thermoanaerobaculia bacterium]|nr:hypothetical protein [Thermoanaerobaculia bacterium]